MPNAPHEAAGGASGASSFHSEYSRALNKLLNSGQGLALHDLLEEMGFLSQEDLASNGTVLQRQRGALLINNFNEVVRKNLFQLLCVIVQISPVSRGQNLMEPQILQQYLKSIDDRRTGSLDSMLLEQIMMMKRLINRPSYSLNAAQQREVQERYHRMYVARV